MTGQLMPEDTAAAREALSLMTALLQADAAMADAIFETGDLRRIVTCAVTMLAMMITSTGGDPVAFAEAMIEQIVSQEAAQ